MRLFAWIYRFVTGKTLGKTRELQARYNTVQQARQQEISRIQNLCLEHNDAVCSYNSALKGLDKVLQKRQASITASLESKPL